MKIVVADPIFLPEEYRARLKALGELEVYDTIPHSQEEFVERIKDAEIVIVGRYGFNSETLRLAPKLKMISLWQTGYDNVDLAAANKQGVVVTNVPNYAFDSVAEFTFALILDLERKVREADTNLRIGKFDWKYHIGGELMSKFIGVIGTGNIGRRVIQIAHGFNMIVLSTTSHPNPERAKKLGVKFVDLDTLLSESDIVTLHVPLTLETRHMIGAKELAKMKASAILINTARGKVIDEAALVKALKEKKIAGAGLDVFAQEPLEKESPLKKLDNVILTPHTAALTRECVVRLAVEAVKATLDVFEGKKPNGIVNPEVLTQPRWQGILSS